METLPFSVCCHSFHDLIQPVDFKYHLDVNYPKMYLPWGSRLSFRLKFPLICSISISNSTCQKREFDFTPNICSLPKFIYSRKWKSIISVVQAITLELSLISLFLLYCTPIISILPSFKMSWIGPLLTIFIAITLD